LNWADKSEPDRGQAASARAADGMLEKLVSGLAQAVLAVDARLPLAVNKRTGMSFGAGLGPHSETETFRLIVEEARAGDPSWFTEVGFDLPYPSSPRKKCDLMLTTPAGVLFVEGKLLRLKGDNGKPNDNMLMHILSPYDQHRSALTDCTKLSRSELAGTKAVVIVGYDYPDLPLEPAIRAFELLARNNVTLGRRYQARFCNLNHAVHVGGSVFAWSVEAAFHNQEIASD
jgi:hypothetical protein